MAVLTIAAPRRRQDVFTFTFLLLVGCQRRIYGHLISAGSGMTRKRCHEEPDEDLVSEVRAYMKANKISQMVVKEQARVSQAVISQWLNLRYHGHTGKVRPARDMPAFSRAPSPAADAFFRLVCIRC